MNVQNLIRSSIFLLSFQTIFSAPENPFARITESENAAAEKHTPINTKASAKKPAIIHSKKLFAAKSTPVSTSQQIPASYEQMIFVPTIPTDSFFSKILETMYGSTDIPLNTLQELQQVYFVLEYFTKLEKIKHDKAHISLQKKYSSLLSPAADDIPFISQGMDLIADADWQKISITQQDVINSDMWQYFLKATIADIFVHNGNFLQVVHEVETQIFNYIPSMETSYYNSDFLSLRNLAEGTRLKLLLNDIIGKKHQAQCVDWAKLSSIQLQSASSSFQSTDFYNYSHNINIWMQQDAKGKLISQKKVTLQHPTKEQVFCYAMIKAAQNNLYAALAESTNMEGFIAQASSSSLLPNIFEYTLNEYVYLDDFFMMQANLATQVAENSQPRTSIKTTNPASVQIQSLSDLPGKQKHKKRYKPEELVKVQDLWGDIGNAFTHAGNDIASGLESAGNAIADSAKQTGDSIVNLGNHLKDDFVAAGYAIKDGVIQTGYAIRDGCIAAGEAVGGLGATLIGDIADDKDLQDKGRELTGEALNNLEQCGNELNKAIDDFGTAIEDGIIAPLADIDGAILAFITQDQSMGLDMTAMINQVADSCVNIVTTYDKIIVNSYIGGLAKAVQLTSDLTNVIVKSVYALANPAAAGDAWAQLGNDMGTAIVGAFNGLVDATKDMFAAIMQTLTYLTSAITTIIIDVSKEATFIGDLIGTGNIQAAKTEEASVGTYLDNHRQTINMVSGIILAIAIDVAVTVATGGAGTAEAVAMSSEMIAGETAVEGAAETGAIVGDEGAVVAATTSTDLGGAVADAGKTATSVASAARTTASTARTATEETATNAVGDTTSITRTASSTARNATEDAGDAGEDTANIASKASKETSSESAPESEAEPEAQEEPEPTTKEEPAPKNEQPKEEQPKEEQPKKEQKGNEKGSQKSPTKKPFRNMKHVALSEGMNAVFNVLGAIGASYQDELSAVQEISQEEGVKNIVSYAMDTALNSSMQQNAMIQETEKKFNANLASQQIGLSLLQDFITTTQVNAAYQSEATGLGQEYQSLLTPQPYDPSKPTITCYPADIGSTWGLITPINSLYPQLGLYTVTTGRPAFPYAQEIAQAPLVIDSETGSNAPQGIDAKTITQLWFNQRVMIPLSSKKATDSLQAEIQFRMLYSLETTTYTGLYLGGTFEDYRSKSYMENLENTGMANLNVAHLAKMFVLIHLPNGTCNIGLYEKDGLGNIKDAQGSSWITYEPLDAAFTKGWPIYDMKATLQGNQLTLTLSRADNPAITPWQKTVTVSPTDQRMLGIITSGTAIEWNILQPKISIQQIPSIRKDSSAQNQISILEKDREIQSLQTWAQLLSQKFGTYTLNALSKYQCMKGNYIYTTTDIHASVNDSKNTPLTDYFVFANNEESGITNIGLNPCGQATNLNTLVIISLGSGNVYDTHGKIIANQKNVWDVYNKAHGPFSSSITNAITAMKTAYLEALVQPKVGVFTLDAVDKDMIANGLYIYTTTQTLTQKGQKGTITDYLVTSTIAQASGQEYPDTIGAPPASTTQALLSLVTGNLYSTNSLTPINTGLEALNMYETNYQKLPAALTKKINDSLGNYTVATTHPAASDKSEKSTPTQTPQKPPVAPKAIIFGSIQNESIANPAATGGISFNDLLGTPQAKTQSSAKPSSASIMLQQQVASGGISFDMNLMMGTSDSQDTPSTSSSANSTNNQITAQNQTQPAPVQSPKKSTPTKSEASLQQESTLPTETISKQAASNPLQQTTKKTAPANVATPPVKQNATKSSSSSTKKSSSGSSPLKSTQKAAQKNSIQQNNFADGGGISLNI